MTDELDMLRATARAILNVERSASPTVGSQPSATWAALDGAGLTSVGFDELRGGSGGSLADIATLVFEVGRSRAMVPLPETVMLSSWLTGLAGWNWSGGAETVGIANETHLETRVFGEKLVLNGFVESVPWARVAKRVLLVTTIDGAVTLVALTPRDVRIQPVENLAGEPRDTLIVDSLELDADKWQMSPLDVETIQLRGALMRACAISGAMCAVFELTSHFAQQREQFGRPIERFQAVQHLLARLSEETSAATSAVSAAVAANATGDGEFESMCAVVRVMQAATQSARIAHQIHGAMGTTTEYPLHHFTQRLWSWMSDYGSETRWCRALSNHVKNQIEENPLWSVVTNSE